MRILAYCTVLLFAASPTYAQPKSTQWNKHVPPGWKYISHEAGSLNGKASEDVVLIIEKDSAELRKSNDALGSETLNLNPRHMVFLTKAKSGYVKTGSAEGFIPPEHNEDAPCLYDPLAEGGMAISKGVLSVTLQYWLSCGSFNVTTRVYKFRVESSPNGKVRHRLIGTEANSFSRSGYGGGTNVSANYLTGKVKVTTGIEGMGPDIEGQKPLVRKESWSKLLPSQFYLENMDRNDCNEYDNTPSWCGF